jgi:hypothetical protein
VVGNLFPPSFPLLFRGVKSSLYFGVRYLEDFAKGIFKGGVFLGVF